MTRRGAVLAAALALALILLTWARIHRVERLDDQGWLLTYVALADGIAAGQDVRAADVSPVYLAFMIALRSAGLSVESIRGVQIALLTLSALLCAIAAGRLGGWTAAAVTAVLILGNRAALVVSSELDPKALVFLLTSAVFAFLVVGRDRDPGSDGLQPVRRTPSPPALIAAGLCAGLAAATHPYGYLLLLVALAWRRSWILALAAILPIAAVMVFSPVESHSGTQFYEGNNALATGCGGVMPREVAEWQARFRDPSADRAYRAIATRAGGNPNRYWRDKAVAFLREYPSVAVRRFATKAILTVHHFDVYDVVTAQRRGVQLARHPAIPFGVAFVLGVCAWILHSRRRDLLPFTVFALAMIAVLTLFVVSARQRNVLLVPLSILGGIGAAEIAVLFRTSLERALVLFGAALIAIAVLGIEGAPMLEYEHLWRRALRLPVDPRSPAARFDRALEVARAGRWQEADAMLASLDGYRPLRQSAGVSSVAYYRARAALARGLPAGSFIARASAEAPGDPNVLALQAAQGDARALRLLGDLHDPLTAERARRHAFGTVPGSGSREAGR